MQLTTRPEWFHTVPVIQAFEPDFEILEYSADFEIDEDARQDIDWILEASTEFAALLKKRGGLSKLSKSELAKIVGYKEAIRDLSRYPLCETGDLNCKIHINGIEWGDFWDWIANYKGFQIFESIAGDILVSQPNEPCFETREDWSRFSEIDPYEREFAAIAAAQEFIDSFVLSQRNDDPEYDWNVLGRLQLSLPL